MDISPRFSAFYKSENDVSPYKKLSDAEIGHLRFLSPVTPALLERLDGLGVDFYFKNNCLAVKKRPPKVDSSLTEVSSVQVYNNQCKATGKLITNGSISLGITRFPKVVNQALSALVLDRLNNRKLSAETLLGLLQK